MSTFFNPGAREKRMNPNVRFSAWCFSWCRGDTGTRRALQAFRLHASDAITMYAQLLTSLSTGAVSA
jgi:hypothetical protein